VISHKINQNFILFTTLGNILRHCEKKFTSVQHKNVARSVGRPTSDPYKNYGTVLLWNGDIHRPLTIQEHLNAWARFMCRHSPTLYGRHIPVPLFLEIQALSC
jgi:hypothetical protein